MSSNRCQNVRDSFNGSVTKLGRDVLTIEIVDRSSQNWDEKIGLAVHDGQMALEGKGGKDVGETGYLCDGPYRGLVTTTGYVQDLEVVFARGFISAVTTRRYLSVQCNAREKTGGVVHRYFCLIDVDGGLTTGMLDGVGAWFLGLWD